MKKKGERKVWKLADSEVWKTRKWQNPVKKGEKADERRWLNRRQRTETRRKDENGCTEVRNREEVPAFMKDKKYWRIII